MTVKDLRTLVDNLDEYIHVPGGIERLKKTILHLAVSGQLVPQNPSEGTGQQLYDQIQAEKQKLINDDKLKKQKLLSEITVEEAQFELPKSWEWVRLGDLGYVGTGATPSRDEPSYYYGNIPWVTSTLTSQALILSTAEHITQKAVAETNCRIYPKNSLVIAMYGQGKTRGQVAKLGIAAATNQACAVFENVAQDYLNTDYLMKMLEYSYNLMRIAASGGAQPNLNVQKIKDITIPLPCTMEQRRIIDKIETIFKLIDELEKKYKAEQKEHDKLVKSSLAKLSSGVSTLALDMLAEIIKTKADAAELRKTILHLAVSGQLVPQDPSEGTGQQLYDQIQVEKAKLIAEGNLKIQKLLPKISKYETPFEIPKSWKWVRLAEATVFSIGRTPARNDSAYWDEGYIPWVSIADLKAGKHIDSTKECVSKAAFDKCFNRQAVRAGTLLYSFKLTIGKMSIIDVDAVHNEAIASLRTFSNETTDYLFKALEVIDPTSRSNSAVMGQTLNSASLSLLEIPLPPLAEQVRIIRITTRLLDQCNKLELQLEK